MMLYLFAYKSMQMYDFFSDVPRLCAEKSRILTYFADLYTRVVMGRWSDD